MSKLSLVAEVCIISATPFAVIASIPYLGPASKLLPDILHAPVMGRVEFFSIYPAMVLLLIFSASIFGQASVSTYYSLNRKRLTGEILKEIELRPGGTLQIGGQFSGKLMNGYVMTTIATPATRDAIFLFFNKDSELGRLHGNYLEEPYMVQWFVPVDSHESEYSISVELHDVYSFKLFRTSKFDERKARWNSSVKAAASPRTTLEIAKMSLPKSSVLHPFDRTRLPLAGWVCVSVRNYTDESYSGCCGIVKTDAGRFRLYDFEQVESSISSDNAKTDETFSLRAQSDTLVCANIIARTPRATIQIDLGGEAIEKDLEIDPQ